MARRTLWLVLGWTMSAIIVIGLYLRWTDVSSPLLIGIVALSPLLVVPVLALALSAWRAWDRKLVLVAAGLGAAYLATFTSPSAVLGCGPETADDAVTIYSHNVLWREGDPAAVAGEIVASQTDIVVLQEVWPAFMAELEANPALVEFRYRTAEPVDGVTGLAVWSRFPIVDASVDRQLGPPTLRTTIDSPYGRFALDAIHTSAPVSDRNAQRWASQLATLATFSTDQPSVMAGDFNATVDHGQFRSLLGSGWTDAHGPKGCGFDATWPDGSRAPTLLRLDHVLVTDHFDVLGVHIGDPAGSDHRPVTATIRFRQ